MWAGVWTRMQIRSVEATPAPTLCMGALLFFEYDCESKYRLWLTTCVQRYYVWIHHHSTIPIKTTIQLACNEFNTLVTVEYVYYIYNYGLNQTRSSTAILCNEIANHLVQYLSMICMGTSSLYDSNRTYDPDSVATPTPTLCMDTLNRSRLRSRL